VGSSSKYSARAGNFSETLHRTLGLICERVRLILERYRVPFLLEHVIHLLPDAPSDFTPAAFLNAITMRTGCGLILDVYNLQAWPAVQVHATKSWLSRQGMPWPSLLNWI
jgi:uncharacterized protein (UPF0276 family)